MTADELRAALAVATDIKKVIKLVTAAAALVLNCGKANDTEGYRMGIELKLRAERAGGVMLRTKKRTPVAKLGIVNVADRWRALADIDDKAFERKISNAHTRLPPGLRPLRPDYVPPSRIRMTISGWSVDEAGCLSRTLEASGETPPLKDERPHV